MTNIAEIGDINENGEKDIIISTEDNYFPNIRTYDSKPKEHAKEFYEGLESLQWQNKNLL